MSVLDYIPKGYENKATTAHLMRVMNCDMRTLRMYIREERRIGAVICSTRQDGGGYWKPNNKQELIRTAATLRSEGLDMLETARCLEYEAGIIEGQETLGFEHG